MRMISLKVSRNSVSGADIMPLVFHNVMGRRYRRPVRVIMMNSILLMTQSATKTFVEYTKCERSVYLRLLYIKAHHAVLPMMRQALLPMRKADESGLVQ